MSAANPFKHAWQASAADAVLPTIEEARSGADRFFRQIRRRNGVEYAAGALVVLMFGAIAAFAPIGPVARLGAALVALGALVVVWQLHRRASAEAPPEAMAMEPILTHQRAQFVRQRDALSRIGLWYLGPLVPGMVLMLFHSAFERGPAALLTLETGHWITVAVNIAVFGTVWWLNHKAARQLQHAIDEIDALRENGE